MYDRQIAYISLLKNGVKTGNAGFVKWESDQTTHKLEIHISGLGSMDTFTTSVKTKDGRMLDEIAIVGGKGDFKSNITGGTAGVDQIPIEELQNIAITLPGNRLLEASWVNRIKKRQITVPQSSAQTETPKKSVPVIAETIKESIQQDELLEMPIKKELNKEAIVHTEQQLEETPAPESLKMAECASPYQYESKWDQLLDTFEIIHPFSNNRSFLKLSPTDFYILRETCQHLSHNSFLLHGYYNYQYLILGKKEDKEEYYLGVPGIYHEREIMAARMFGFEGFEPTKKECSEGSFGYYCVKVAI